MHLLWDMSIELSIQKIHVESPIPWPIKEHHLFFRHQSSFKAWWGWMVHGVHALKAPRFPNRIMSWNMMLDVFWMFFMTFRYVLWRLVGHLWCLKPQTPVCISMPVVSPQSLWWKPPYLLAMYCHCGLPRIPGIKLPIPSSAQGSWSQSFGADRRISADCCKEQSLRWWRDNRWQPMATDVDILYESVGQIRHGFFWDAPKDNPPNRSWIWQIGMVEDGVATCCAQTLGIIGDYESCERQEWSK